jgi:hypothetical protein
MFQLIGRPTSIKTSAHNDSLVNKHEDKHQINKIHEYLLVDRHDQYCICMQW